jgi:predicted RecB family nuclease
MATKITREIVESYLHCKYKGHLKLAGQQDTRPDYELLLAESRNELRCRAIDKIFARHQGEEVARDVVLTASVLKQGAVFILNGTLEDDQVTLAFDGLQRMPGPSKLGDFHYVPVLFSEGRQVRKQQRTLVDVYGLLLSPLQGRAPSSGIIWHGKECRATRVRLNPDPRKAQRLLEELRQLQIAEAPPRLLLNDHCTVCEFRHRCQQQAVQEDNLSLLRGMKEKEIKAYARKGILTVTQLAHTFRPRRQGKRAPPRGERHAHPLQALAVRDKKVYVFGTPQLPASPVRIYLDVEGNPDEGFDYLVGLIVVAGDREERYSFWADTREQEAEIFEKFLAVVCRYQDFLVFGYGGYERAFLQRMRKRARRKKAVDRVLKALVNVLSLVYAHVYFPCYSNGLKEIGGYLDCSWTEPEASGIQSLVWRKRWEDTKAQEWKEKLLTYNLEDCTALRKVTEFVGALQDGERRTMESPPDGHGPAIEHVQNVDELPGAGAWAEGVFSHPDYAYINRCAYFDYQRQRVYVRTNVRLKRNHRKAQQSQNRTLRISKHLEVIASKCPRCGSTEIQRRTLKKRAKRAFDVVMTYGSMKKKVIECRAPVHTCERCGNTFIPEEYRRLAKHYHGLKCWAMYHHIAHGISFGILEEMAKELFGLRIYKPELKMFKSLMARYYRPTYRSLLKKILAGTLLHVDETEVKLQTGKGYVWVFTNLQEVAFMYKPTRDGDFLRELLKDSHGVLVSDFYAAYDAIECPQQKCLIHLIRDMNQELLNNPYDEELRSITQPFGILLRAIVATIDEHGLKRRHMQKHAKDVAAFFQRLSDQTFRSDPSETLRKRLMKCQSKLFTFIDHDGVPWNNNNAENAIKRFASYREKAGARLTEAGLNDFLVLLSICHTCRYNEISFLRFLLSRERDIDAFGIRRHARRRPVIEVYPKGFIPPHLAPRQKMEDQKSEMAGEPIDQESG